MPGLLARVRYLAPRLLLAATAVAVAVPLLFEIVFRFQLVDTYRAELEAYNPPAILEGDAGRPTLLAMGDSLTAGLHSYPALLSSRLPDWRVVNAGVPATGAFHAALIAPRRINRFAPAVVVYEVNLTNDLINERFPIAWGELSVARNLYWTLAQRLRGLEYLNFRVAQIWYGIEPHRFSAAGPVEVDPSSSCEHDADAFAPEYYTPRERLYLRAEPGLIENQVSLRGGRERDFASWIAEVEELLAPCSPPRCRPKLLIVPLASQVSRSYRDEAQTLGARFEDPVAFERSDYGFLRTLRGELLRRGLTHVEVIDALPALREAERKGVRTFYRYDPHLNFCGQQVLAELVAAALER